MSEKLKKIKKIIDDYRKDVVNETDSRWEFADDTIDVIYNILLE